MIAIPNNPLFLAQTPLYEHTVHIEREQHGLVCFQENHRWTIEFSGFDSVTVLHRTSGDHSPRPRSPLRHLPQHKAAHLHFPYHIKTTSPRHITHKRQRAEGGDIPRLFLVCSACEHCSSTNTHFLAVHIWDGLI